MSGLRVLLTNMSLATRSGTETYVRDLALGLRRRGHTPIVYSTFPGDLAQELRVATVLVVDDLRDVALPPDLIHGHHHPETVTALLHFPGVPAVFCCHDRMSSRDTPPRCERIRRYVAVDDTCRDRLLYEHGIPDDRLAVLRNAVDLERFRPRPPLPNCPRRALVFSHYASEHTHLPAVRQACDRVGLPLDVIGLASGNPCARPEEVLGQYDLVFAKARCALEASAVGTAVVLCDGRGTGPMVTAAEYDDLCRYNLGLRTLTGPLCPDALLREMARYDPHDAAAVSRRVRVTAGLEHQIDAALALYEEVLREHGSLPPSDPLVERRELAACLRWLTSVKELWAFQERAHEAETARAAMRAERDHWQALCARTIAEREDVRARWVELRAEYERLRRETEQALVNGVQLQTELAHLKQSRWFRLRERLVRLPLLRRPVRPPAN
ncbi:MAG: glycosyltransferase [Planctomycetes bacterium]|nr:glycosyltransferase [Planctomycetota bacterium]